jgi:hypothetical protein
MDGTGAADDAGQARRQAILILGMHRSGTSAVSGVVCALGAAAPNLLLPADHDNPRGYWEPWALVNAHDEMLIAAGSSWDDWRPLNADWYRSPQASIFHDQLRNILQTEYQDKPLFAVKDPRICRFLPFFLSVLEEISVAPAALFVFRHPLEVAFSLRRRNGFSVAKSIALWLRHVLEAERHSRNIPRHFISYGNLLKDWRGELKRAGDTIGIAWPADPEISGAAIEKFLSMDLRHEKNELDVSSKYPELAYFAEETHRLLNALARDQGDRDLIEQIDDVHERFDRSCHFFSTIMAEKEVVRQREAEQLARRGPTPFDHGDVEKTHLCSRFNQFKQLMNEVQNLSAQNGVRQAFLDEWADVLSRTAEEDKHRLTALSSLKIHSLS